MFMNIYWVPGASAGGFVAAHLDDCSPIFCPLHLHFWDWSERQWYWKLANKSKEGKGLFEQYCQLMHVFMQNKTSWLFLNLMHFWKGDDQAKWLNLTCQVQRQWSQRVWLCWQEHNFTEWLKGYQDISSRTHTPAIFHKSEIMHCH